MPSSCTVKKEKILIGISECLLGRKVRFNGGHQHNRYITDTLGKYFRFQAYCPEIAIGLGVPRAPIRLVGNAKHPRAIGTKDNNLDVTDKLKDYGQTVANSLPTEMCGFIVKSKSPSCGMERVKVYHVNGNPNTHSRGLFTAELLKQNPNLPIEEEGRLTDPVLRENFIERVFLLYRWKSQFTKGLTAKGLLEFHTKNKLSLMAHHPLSYKELGNLLANLKEKPIDEIADEYFSKLMCAFTYKATIVKITNVLQHCAGHLKKQLDSFDKQELANIIQRYYQNEIPLIVPITLLQHYFRKYPDPYIKQQTFLSPYPQELRLRSTV